MKQDSSWTKWGGESGEIRDIFAKSGGFLVIHVLFLNWSFLMLLAYYRSWTLSLALIGVIKYLTACRKKNVQEDAEGVSMTTRTWKSCEDGCTTFLECASLLSNLFLSISTQSDFVFDMVLLIKTLSNSDITSTCLIRSFILSQCRDFRWVMWGVSGVLMTEQKSSGCSGGIFIWNCGKL